MTPGGRSSAGIEILADVLETGRPASEALREWGRKNRYAGSSDRAAIGNLVYAALRRKRSLAAAMGADDPRALILGALRWVWGEGAQDVGRICNGEGHAPAVLTPHETTALDGDGLSQPASGAVGADVPDWLWPDFAEAFGDRAVAEGQGLGARPPVDIRVNTTLTSVEKLASVLARHRPSVGKLSPTTLRFETPEGPKRHPNIEAETSHGRGHFEIQDQGSQIAAALAGAKAGMQVVDYCAGAGGKTLALAAAMGGKGQVHAYDADRRRLRPLVERMTRARARNIQIRDVPRGGHDGLDDLRGKADVVLVDAPCSGTGVWRRRPEAKWRLRAKALEIRCAEQATILSATASLVKPGGRLVYVTCSVLPRENTRQVENFLEQNQSFAIVPFGQAWSDAIGTEPPRSADGSLETLLLTPASHGTDGFFIAVMKRGEN